jgi:hypothetical protein
VEKFALVLAIAELVGISNLYSLLLLAVDVTRLTFLFP